MLSGAIQRNGIAATSCVRNVVIESRSVEAQAASPIHSSRSVQDGAPAEAASATTAAGSLQRAPDHASNAHKIAKQTYATDQICPCARVGRFGSTSGG